MSGLDGLGWPDEIEETDDEKLLRDDVREVRPNGRFGEVLHDANRRRSSEGHLSMPEVPTCISEDLRKTEGLSERLCDAGAGDSCSCGSASVSANAQAVRTGGNPNE